MTGKMKKTLLWVLLLLLLAVLAIGGAELFGQANKSAADAGSNAANMEIAGLEMIKPGKSIPSCDWKLERKLFAQLSSLDSDYQKLITKAQSELSSGQVSDATRTKALANANSFLKVSNEYADMWEKCNGKTRAKLARETGIARVKNAEMTFNGINSSAIAAYNKQQEIMNKARQAYVAEAKDDLSTEDKQAINSSLTPKLKQIATNIIQLISTVTGLVKEISSQASSMASDPVGAIVGCAGKSITTGDPTAGVSELLGPVKNLLSLLQNLSSNIKMMSSDLSTLAS